MAPATTNDDDETRPPLGGMGRDGRCPKLPTTTTTTTTTTNRSEVRCYFTVYSSVTVKKAEGEVGNQPRWN